MNLIVNQMVKLQVVHVSDCYRAVKILSCSTISESYLTISRNRNSLPLFSVVKMFTKVLHNALVYIILMLLLEIFPLHIYIIVGKIKCIHNRTLVCTLKNRCRYIKSKSLGSKT